MFDYTQNNYLKFGYNNIPFQARGSEKDVFFVNYQKASSDKLNFKEELVKTAKQVSTLTNEEIVICYSGGLDSELVIKSFMAAKIPFRAATVVFTNGQNEHDIDYARRFCSSNSIPHDLYKLDLENFLKNQLFSYTDPISCVSPQFPVVMWLIDQIKGFPIVASGDMYIKREPNTNTFYFHEKEKYFSYYFHLLRKKRKGIPAFLQYTPELLLSFLKDPTLTLYLNGKAKDEKLLSIGKYKYHIYQAHFEMEQRVPYNGFEYLEELDLEYRSLLERKFPNSDEVISFEVNDLIKILSPRN